MPKSAIKNATKTWTMPYGVAEQLRSAEEMAAYLDAWLDEAPDVAPGIARALGDIASAKGRYVARSHTTCKLSIRHQADNPGGKECSVT